MDDMDNQRRIEERERELKASRRIDEPQKEIKVQPRKIAVAYKVACPKREDLKNRTLPLSKCKTCKDFISISNDGKYVNCADIRQEARSKAVLI